MSIRILIITRHRLLADAIAISLMTDDQLDVRTASGDLGRLAHDVERADPHIVVIDAADAGADGIHLVSKIHEWQPDARVLVVTDDEAPDLLIAALRAGASGCLTRKQSFTDLVGMIRRAHAGEPLYDSDLLVQLLTRVREARVTLPRRRILTSLSPRERQVLEAVACGLTIDDVAERLKITKNTVRTHLKRILVKLNVHSTREAVVLLLRDEPSPLDPGSPTPGPLT